MSENMEWKTLSNFNIQRLQEGQEVPKLASKIPIVKQIESFMLNCNATIGVRDVSFIYIICPVADSPVHLSQRLPLSSPTQQSMDR